MCGLVGYFGDWTLAREKGFYDLLRMDVLRGPDSTGVAFVSTNGAVEICKDALLPEELMGLKEFEKAEAMRWNGYIGHNRFATKGAVSKENAHPFKHGNIIGAHNGTLNSQYHLPDSEKFDVDSENIIYAINKIGIAETWKKLNGAAALSWWDNKKRTLNLLRNNERIVFFARTKADDGVFWASESWMLYGMADRNDIKLDKIYFLPKNVLYSFSLYKEKKDMKLKLVEAPLEEYKFVYSGYTGFSFNNQAGLNDGLWADIKEKEDNKEETEKKNGGGGNSVSCKADVKPGRYALVPEKIIRVFNKNNLMSNKLICSLHRNTTIKIELMLTDEHIEKFTPYINHPRLFSDVLFICNVKPITYYTKGNTEIILTGAPDTVQIHVPKNSYRTMLTGAKLTKEQFDNIYKSCVYCGTPVSFNDTTLVEDSEGPNILCGDCVKEAKEKRAGNYSVDDIFKMARNP